MKRSAIILLVVALLAYMWTKNCYNGMVTLREKVSTEWSNVENQYQRRADLIPNLVNTVKGYAAHESSTFESVVEARAKATQMQVDFNSLDAQTLARFNQLQSELSSALSRLMAISEAYPDLKASQNFRDLQTQLEGAENRISVERRNFNEAARAYNTSIQLFPRNIVANIFGFTPKAYFEAEPESHTAPTVSFE